MKTFASFILIIIFIPIFLVWLLALTVKFEVLDPQFWQNTFGKHDVYSQLAVSLKNDAVNQITKQGGNKNEAKVLTDLITPLNLKSFVDQNLANLLNYANGKKSQLFVYIPYKLIPKNYLPTDLTNLSEQMPIDAFMSKFNITTISYDQIQQISRFGPIINYSVILSSVVLLLFSLLLYLLVDNDHRPVGISVVFITCGALAIILAEYVQRIQINTIETVLIVVNPTIYELTRFWIWTGVALIVVGVAVVFFKKP